MRLGGCNCLLEVVTVSVRRMGSGLLFSSTFVACFIRLGIARWIPNIFLSILC